MPLCWKCDEKSPRWGPRKSCGSSCGAHLRRFDKASWRRTATDGHTGHVSLIVGDRTGKTSSFNISKSDVLLVFIELLHQLWMWLCQMIMMFVYYFIPRLSTGFRWPQDVEVYRSITGDAKVLLLELRQRCKQLRSDGTVKAGQAKRWRAEPRSNWVPWWDAVEVVRVAMGFRKSTWWRQLFLWLWVRGLTWFNGECSWVYWWPYGRCNDCGAVACCCQDDLFVNKSAVQGFFDVIAKESLRCRRVFHLRICEAISTGWASLAIIKYDQPSCATNGSSLSMNHFVFRYWSLSINSYRHYND